MKGGFTFRIVDNLSNISLVTGDSLTVTENGWVKVWFRKRLVGVIKDWRQVCLLHPDQMKPVVRMEK